MATQGIKVQIVIVCEVISKLEVGIVKRNICERIKTAPQQISQVAFSNRGQPGAPFCTAQASFPKKFAFGEAHREAEERSGPAAVSCAYVHGSASSIAIFGGLGYRQYIHVF